MNKNFLTVSIGIPAHNEEANIEHLLRSIFIQKEEFFILKEIIVISDGSTDRTDDVISSIEDRRLRIVKHAERKGKLARLNELFESFTSDILIQLDADIRFAHEEVLKNLVRPLIDDSLIAMVCGAHQPIKPSSIVEKCAYFGVEVWEKAVEMLGQGGDRYHCTGQIRAFSRFFTEQFRLPAVGSSEDAYSFYYAKTKGFKVVYASNALVYFKQPDTFFDYIKQMQRFLKIPRSLAYYFGQETVQRYEILTNKIKLRALLYMSFRRPPHIVLGFLLLQVISHSKAKMSPIKNVWSISKSSKNFKTLS